MSCDWLSHAPRKERLPAQSAEESGSGRSGVIRCNVNRVKTDGQRKPENEPAGYNRHKAAWDIETLQWLDGDLLRPGLTQRNRPAV